MKKNFYNLMLAVVFIFSTGLQVKAQTPPTTSTPGNDVWYYIQCMPRSSNSDAKWLTGGAAGVVVTNQVISGTDDAQQWKVVANGSGIALVNKLGTYLNTDGPVYPTADLMTSVISCVAAAPSLTLKLWPYVDQTAAGRPGGFYLVNLDATTPITNATNSSLTFQFYSAGSGSNFRPINYGVTAPNINSSIKFMQAKDILKDAINIATSGYNNSSEGLNPGQYTADDRDALLALIEAAQAVYDNTSATNAQLLSAADELNSNFTLFKSNVILPESSNDSKEVWYYIQGTRPANTYMTAPAAGAGTQVKDLAVVPNDFQLWKLVPNGDGFALQNKGSQEYLQTDFPTGTNLNTQAAKPTKALRFITSSETFNKSYRFWIENTTSSTEAFRLHAGGSGNGWGLMNWTGNKDDNCTWLFLSEDEVFRVELTNTKTKAQALYDSTVEGGEFGQYTTAKRTAFNTVIITEGAKNMATMTQTELKESNQALLDAMAAYECNRDVSTLSSVVKKKWFRLVSNSSAAYANGKAISSNGRTVDQKFTFETKDVASNAQLFSFELNETGTAAISIVNKANSLFMGKDGMMVATAPVTEFEITPLDAVSFWIKPTGVNPLHAQDNGSHIVNWNSGANSSSAWKFEYVSSEDITDFKSAYLAKRIQMRTKVNAAKLVAGAQIGQYTPASVTTLENLVVAEEAKNADALTQNEMRDAILAMNAASTGLVVNTDVKLLVSTTSGANKWFRLINNMAGAGYASGKAMSSNGRLEGEKFTYEEKDVNSDAQLFRFELTTDQTQVANIINKSSGMYVAADGKMAAASTTDNNFAITQLGTGRSFWIDPTLADTDPLHAAYDGTEILNWLAGEGSASAWIFEFVGESTGLINLFPVENKIRTTNNIITVDGIDNFDVYSATGQKQNHRARLATGVYIVRFNNYVQKVVLK